LVTVANAADLETQRCIAYALCNLAADPRRRSDIVREGGLPSLISMACSDDRSDQLAAMATLRGITSQADNRRSVYLANLTEALTVGTRCIDVEVKCETAGFMCALSINDENKLDMANNDQVLISLIELLRVDDPRCLRQGMGTLANITERQESHPFLRRFQIHIVVLEHINSTDVALSREACRCITNLAAIHENHPPIVGGGAIQSLIKGCAKGDALSARYSALGLMNLATLKDNHNDLVHYQAFEPLILLAAGQEKLWYQLDSMGETLPGNDEPNTPRSRGDWEFINQYKYDREARRYAVLALGNLAISPASHGPIMQEHSVAALNQCLDSPDDETRFNAAFCLNKLAMEEGNIEFLGNSGAIPLLIDILSTGSVDSIAQATATLRHLSYRVENRILMIHANLLDPLATVAESKDKETLREVAAMCCQLSLTEAVRLPLVSSALLVPLTALC
jgi:hypothetical protein